MDNNNRQRPLPLQKQRQLQYERQKKLQEEKLRRIKILKRRLFIRRAIVLTVMALICVSVVLLVMKFIDMATQTVFNPERDTNQGDVLPNEDDDQPVEAHAEEFDPLSLIDPSTLNPNDKIYINYREDQVLPTPYEYSNTPYNTFSSDNPVLGSNTSKKVIVIDAGHQTDTRVADVWLSPYLNPSVSSSWVKNSYMKIGTKGVSTGIVEYETTHKIADKLKTALEALGYTVYLSHPDVTEKLCGAERAEVANKNNADLMISLHCDSYAEDKTVSGTLALVPDVWDGYPSERLSYLSEKAATVILDEYTTATGLKNRGYKPVIQTSMFSFCKVPIFLLEMGFSSCPSDDKNMNDEEFQEKMVSGIVNGINKYFALIELGKTTNAND